MLLAPNLGWRDLSLRDPLAAALDVPVQIENSGKACALAQLWSAGSAKAPAQLRRTSPCRTASASAWCSAASWCAGSTTSAGEFGHVPLNIDGPRCGCGATGCWEAYVSNLATLSRYFGRDLRARPVSPDATSLTVDDLIARARGGDVKALAALLSTGRYLGIGLGSVVNAIDPSHVYIGGEITTAWDLIEDHRARGARRARADAIGRRDARSRSCPPSSIHGFAAPPPSSPPPSFAEGLVA